VLPGTLVGFEGMGSGVREDRTKGPIAYPGPRSEDLGLPYSQLLTVRVAKELKGILPRRSPAVEVFFGAGAGKRRLLHVRRQSVYDMRYFSWSRCAF
jgi:hypothetical protein